MTHHLGDIRIAAKNAIVTGDPDRVTILSDVLGGARETWRNRGFVCAQLTDERLLLCSTGIGGPATAIVAEELAQLGVSSIVRVGTCGSLQPLVRPGHLLISAASVRDDGASAAYLPAGFPAVSAPDLLQRLIWQAGELSRPHHVGITHCKDAYYAESPEGLPLEGEWRERWTMLRKLGVLATEMEAAALHAVGQVRGLRTGAIFVPTDDTLSAGQRREALSDAAMVAARALVDDVGTE
jgi:uridine phosphorylase